MTTFATAPSEILVHVFKEFDYLSLHLSIAPVCKRFYDIVKNTDTGPLVSNLLKLTKDPKVNAEPPKKFPGTIVREVRICGSIYISKVNSKAGSNTGPHFTTALYDSGSDVDPDTDIESEIRFEEYNDQMTCYATLHPCIRKIRLNRHKPDFDNFDFDETVGFVVIPRPFVKLVDTLMAKKKALYNFVLNWENRGSGYPWVRCHPRDRFLLQRLTVKDFMDGFMWAWKNKQERHWELPDTDKRTNCRFDQLTAWRYNRYPRNKYKQFAFRVTVEKGEEIDDNGAAVEEEVLVELMGHRIGDSMLLWDSDDEDDGEGGRRKKPRTMRDVSDCALVPHRRNPYEQGYLERLFNQFGKEGNDDNDPGSDDSFCERYSK